MWIRTFRRSFLSAPLTDILTNLPTHLTYCSPPQVYQAFYAENEAMDVTTVRNEEHDVVYFEEALTKYTEQHRLTTEIKETRNIGMMVVDTKKLKEVSLV